MKTDTLLDRASSTVPFRSAGRFVRAVLALGCIALFAVALASMPGAVDPAHADEVSEAKDALAQAESELADLREERDALEAGIAKLQEEIDAVAAQAIDAQRACQESLDRLKNSAVFHYKLGGVTLYDMVLSSASLTELLSTADYLEAIESSLAAEARNQQDRTEALKDTMRTLDAKKIEQNALRDELAAKEDEAQALVEEASARVDEAEQERLEALAALAAPSGSVFETGVIDGSWQLGFASAYSFADNDGWDATASGIPLDWTSYTVAVPISQRYLLGRSVEISYNGMSLVATITDVGGFEAYGRALDLAPGVWRAFGAGSVNEWGVRQVAYRFL